jgi:hypothetical protein
MTNYGYAKIIVKIKKSGICIVSILCPGPENVVVETEREVVDQFENTLKHFCSWEENFDSTGAIFKDNEVQMFPRQRLIY